MINTTNIDTTESEARGGFVSKGLNPGNHKCQIHNVTLEENKFSNMKNADGTPRKEWNIKLNLVGPTTPNFDGFFKDWNDQTKGKYLGPQGNVRATEYGLYNGTTLNGFQVDRDKDLATWMKTFCDELGITDWLNSQNGKHPTWDSLYAQLDVDKPFANKEVYFCLAAREYVNKKGYKAHDLFLPRKSDLGRPFSLNELLVQKFIESVHLKVSKPKTVEGFGNTTAPAVATQADVNKGAEVLSVDTPIAGTNAVITKTAEIVNTPSATPFTDDLFGSGNTDFLNQKDDKLVGNPITVKSEDKLPAGCDPLPFSLD